MLNEERLEMALKAQEVTRGLINDVWLTTGLNTIKTPAGEVADKMDEILKDLKKIIAISKEGRR